MRENEGKTALTIFIKASSYDDRMTYWSDKLFACAFPKLC